MINIKDIFEKIKQKKNATNSNNDESNVIELTQPTQQVTEVQKSETVLEISVEEQELINESIIKILEYYEKHYDYLKEKKSKKEYLEDQLEDLVEDIKSFDYYEKIDDVKQIIENGLKNRLEKTVNEIKEKADEAKPKEKEIEEKEIDKDVEDILKKYTNNEKENDINP